MSGNANAATLQRAALYYPHSPQDNKQRACFSVSKYEVAGRGFALALIPHPSFSLVVAYSRNNSS